MVKVSFLNNHKNTEKAFVTNKIFAPAYAADKGPTI